MSGHVRFGTQVPQLAKWPVIAVILLPIVEVLFCIDKCEELIHVRALVAQPAVEVLYVPVLRRFSGMREVALHTTLSGLLFERLRDVVRAMVERDGDRRVVGRDPLLERRPDSTQRLELGVNELLGRLATLVPP